MSDTPIESRTPVTPVWIARFFKGDHDAKPIRTAYISRASEEDAAGDAFKYMQDEHAIRVELCRVARSPQIPFGETRWLD